MAGRPLTPGQPFDATRTLRQRAEVGVDLRAIEQATIMLLHAIGEDPSREGLRDTPGRVARAWQELTAGMRSDPAQALSRTFTLEGAGDLIVQSGLSFYSCCEHHLVPFHGTVSIGYIPGERLVGLSKLARVVEGYARRLQVQERLTAQIADAVYDTLGAVGVIVVVRAQHLCMMMRGVRTPHAATVTSAVRGALKDDARARTEALTLLGGVI